MRQIILVLLIAACLVGSATARRRKEVIQEEAPQPDEQVEVVQSNHFESQTQTSTQFKTENLIQDKPLLFLLEPNQINEEKNITFQISENPITVTIEAGNEKETCEISNFYGLCSIPKVTVKEATIKASCKTTPCQIRWRIEQPETIEVDGDHKLNHLVAVNQDKNHAILKVYCNNPELKSQLTGSIDLYTNSAFEQISTAEEEIVYLFNNQKKGYYFMTTKNQAIEGCAQVTLQHAIEEIDLKEEGVMFHDFFSNREVNTYELTSKPTSDLMVEMMLHDAGMGELQNQTGIMVKLVGLSNHKQTVLHQLSLVADDQKEFIVFSTVLKKPSADFDKFELHLSGLTEESLIGTINFKPTNSPQVQFGQQTWFDLKKGDKINYKLIPIAKEIDNVEKQNLFLSDKTKFNLSTQSCGKEGCSFTLQALEDGKGYVYIGQDEKKKQTEIVLEEFTKSVKSKLREGEILFYQYKLPANKAVQMVINSPSTVVYVADKKKCEPSKLRECYQKQFNSHNPSFYEAKEETEVAFMVVGLDNCEFTMTMLQSNQAVIELKDSEPFVYLMDDNQNQLTFGFKLDQKEDVSFNLIGPLNELTLVVFNKEKLGKEDSNAQTREAEISMDGYVSFEKNDLKSNFFVIKVEKRQEYRKKYVHFTLIASTKEANLRLQAGNAHYQTLKSGAERDYVFQLIPQSKTFLNFYTHNLKSGVNLVATLSPTDEYKDKDATVTYKIDRETDVIEIGEAAEKLCSAESEKECEIFVRVKNNMQVEADVTITLLLSNSVIELKDGIWQTYDINEAAATAHFYFLPKYQKHSITIFYHSTNVDLKIAYNLWKTDDTSIVPSEWPFPYQYNEANPSPSPLAFKPTRFIHIEGSQLQSCWPHCVVLLSLLPYEKELEQFQKKTEPFYNLNHDFKIMASNNYIQLPEKVKVDLVLNRAQQKYLLVDLKYAKDRQSIVFFNYLTTGSVVFKGNVYSQKNPRCPTMESSESDFQFIGVQNEFEVENIKKKLQDNNMENDKNQYICILAYAFVESKASIEFVSEVSDIKNIPVDTTTAVTLRNQETRVYQLNAHFEFFVKIARTSGFPYISRKLCDPKNDDMEKCLEDFRNSQEKGEQLANKIMAITETPCQSCMLYIKIKAQEEANLTIHSQSRYAEIQLKENNPLTDVLAPGELNRYMITAHREKEIILNIQILSGNIKIEMHDFGNVHINKENAKGSSSIHLVVPSKDQQEEQKEAGTTLVHAFGLSNFNQLHLSVQTQNPKEPASYIITYSNGQHITYLEDGLISQHVLRASQPTKFLYNSPGSARVYLYLSAADAQILSNVMPTVYGLNNPEDEDDRVELSIEKPTFMKKAVNPTMLVYLPGKSHYQIFIQNKNAKDVSLSIGVNDRQIIYLPFDHEFPFKLEPKEYLYFSLPVTAPGYVKLTLNKCSSCDPYIAFTQDYNEFIAQNFQTEQQISDGLTYENVIHAKKAGGLYVKVRTPEEKESILTLKATFSSNKIVENKARAGDRGNIEYQLLDSTKAQITYSGVVCDKSCNGQFAYSAITSPSQNRIISQLVCTSVSFDLLGFAFKDAPDVQNISSAKSNSKVTFNHSLKQHTEYLGIKAYNSKTGQLVYYPPVQILTFQGRIDKAAAIATQGNNLSWIVVSLVLIVVCWVLIAYRRYQKKREAYRPLTADIHDTIDD